MNLIRMKLFLRSSMLILGLTASAQCARKILRTENNPNLACRELKQSKSSRKGQGHEFDLNVLDVFRARRRNGEVRVFETKYEGLRLWFPGRAVIKFRQQADKLLATGERPTPTNVHSRGSEGHIQFVAGLVTNGWWAAQS